MSIVSDVSGVHQNFMKFYSEMKQQIYPELEQTGIDHLSHLSGSEYSSGNFIDILRSKVNVTPLPYSEFMYYEDMDYITQNLKYYIGIPFTMRPYINILRPGFHQDDQTQEDHLYLRYSSLGFQDIYSFWDRLGDLLYLYFETGLKKRDVDWNRVMNQIAEPYKSSPEYNELINHYVKNVRSKILLRQQIVHYFQLELKHRWSNIQNDDDPIKQKEFNDEKYIYADSIQEQLRYCLDGYLLTLKVISILPDK